jgi:uncharacterized membrane protein YhdT
MVPAISACFFGLVDRRHAPAARAGTISRPDANRREAYTPSKEAAMAQDKRPCPARFAQARKEALWILVLYLGYFVWWYAFAYGLGSGDPENYSYVLGFPAWFFYSCIAGMPVITIALWLIVRLCFRDMPLDEYLSDTGDNPPASAPDPAAGMSPAASSAPGGSHA